MPDGGHDECEKNACGECGQLEHEVGEPCGPCGADVYICSQRFVGDTECSGATLTVDCNEACDGDGGDLGEPCGACGLGEWACSPAGKRVCTGIALGMNACGGCQALEHEPGEACGKCGLDRYQCDLDGTVTCSGDTTVNACGGCSALDHQPGEMCDGEDADFCDDDVYACDGQGGVACAKGDDACDSCRVESVTYGDENPDDEHALEASGCDTVGTLRVVGGYGFDSTVFRSVRRVDQLIVEDARDLVSFRGLDNLKTLGSLLIHGAAALENLKGLAQLESLDFLEIHDARHLRSLDGLGPVALSDGVSIENVPRLTSVEALSSVTTTTIISIVDAPALASLHGLEQVEKVGRVRLNEVPVLSALDGLKSLKEVGFLQLCVLEKTSDPPAGLLTDLRGLASLAYADAITICNQASLTSLAGLPPRFQGLEVAAAPKLVHAEIPAGPLTQTSGGAHVVPSVRLSGNDALESVTVTQPDPAAKYLDLALADDPVLTTLTVPATVNLRKSVHDCPLLQDTPAP